MDVVDIGATSEQKDGYAACQLAYGAAGSQGLVGGLVGWCGKFLVVGSGWRSRTSKLRIFPRASGRATSIERTTP